jgi:group I intron endonuclease
MPIRPGVYALTNRVTGYSYVGSTINLLEREAQHFHALYDRKHHNYLLQRAYNKFGVHAFFFVTLEYVDRPYLAIREQIWLDRLMPHIYNIKKLITRPTFMPKIKMVWVDSTTPRRVI